jgi:hypothetical protein
MNRWGGEKEGPGSSIVFGRRRRPSTHAAWAVSPFLSDEFRPPWPDQEAEDAELPGGR